MLIIIRLVRELQFHSMKPIIIIIIRKNRIRTMTFGLGFGSVLGKTWVLVLFVLAGFGFFPISSRSTLTHVQLHNATPRYTRRGGHQRAPERLAADTSGAFGGEFNSLSKSFPDLFTSTRQTLPYRSIGMHRASAAPCGRQACRPGGPRRAC